MVRRLTAILNKSQIRVLIAVSELRHVTIPQLLTYLDYSNGTKTQRGQGKKGSYSLIAKACQDLCEMGMIEKIVWSSLAFKGRPPGIYVLDREGKRWLERNGYQVDSNSYDAAKKLKPTSVLWPHTLACVDWQIGVHRLTEQVPQLRLEAAKSEYHCKRLTVKVKVQGEKATRTARVQPDGWVRIATPQGVCCFALEYDLGSEEVSRIKDKVQAYLKFVQADYQRLYGTQSMTLLFVTPKPYRLAALMKWTAEELNRLKATPAQGDLFRFAEFVPAELEPAKQFFLPIWHTLLHNKPVTLLGA